MTDEEQREADRVDLVKDWGQGLVEVLVSIERLPAHEIDVNPISAAAPIPGVPSKVKVTARDTRCRRDRSAACT
jgi:hypothetical protein